MACRTCSTDRPPRHRRRRQRPAFSLAEALTASVVLAIAVVGVAGPLAAAGEQAEIARENGTAIVLAKSLIEEIASKPLLDGGGTTCSLGPEAGETDRSKFDSADDYHGFHDSSTALKNLSGTLVAVPPGYSRDVTVEYRASPAGAAASSGDYGVVTVVVTSPHHLKVTIVRLMAKARVTSTS